MAEIGLMELLSNAGADLGSKVEILIKKGAEWCDGHTGGPAAGPQGYEAPRDLSQLSDLPGLSVIGYISQIRVDQYSQRVTLVPMSRTALSDDLTESLGPFSVIGSYFVDAKVIQEVKHLESITKETMDEVNRLA